MGVWASGGGDPAHYTAFLQSDAFRHVLPQLFHLVMRALRHGTLDVPFVHLSRARMVASASPCKRAIYQHVLDSMDSLPAEGCEAIRPGTGMHCLQFESMWHVMFGLPDRLSSRAEDTSLPIFFRFPETDFTHLPDGFNSSLYLGQAAAEPDMEWLDALVAETNVVEVSGSRSIGYLKV